MDIAEIKVRTVYLTTYQHAEPVRVVGFANVGTEKWCRVRHVNGYRSVVLVHPSMLCQS